MEIISNFNGEENIIATRLSEIEPHTVAVAYVGRDWEIYCDTFKELIVSPTIGTNPYALEDIVEKIGIDNVYFVDNLHSKIYIGKSKALIGSSNLSNNALSDCKLLEAAVLITNKEHIENIQNIVDKYKELAKEQYPSAKHKKDQIEILKQMPRIPSTNFKKTELTKYDVENSNNRIIIAWYGCSELEYDKNIESDFNEDEDQHNTFLEEDEIYPGDWILNWKITQQNQPHKAVRPHWFKVTQCIPNGDTNEENFPYTKIAYEKNLHSNAVPPFNIDDNIVIDCFKAVMTKENFNDFWDDSQVGVNGNKVWKIPSQKRTREFLKAWQEAVSKKRK